MRTRSLSLTTATLMLACLLASACHCDIEEFPICVRDGGQWWPEIYGDTVIWVDTRNGNRDIYGMDLSTQEEFPICTEPHDQGEYWGPDLYGDIVAWQDKRNDEWDIYGKDLGTNEEFPIAVGPGPWQLNLDVYENIVVWEDDRNGHMGIYGKNLDTGDEFEISVSDSYDKWDPQIYGEIVVWQDQRHGVENCKIFAKDLSSGDEFAVWPVGDGQTGPRIWGTLIVWDQKVGEDLDIYAKDLATGEGFVVCDAPGSQSSAGIYGDLVVWADARNGDFDIYGKLVTGGIEFPICTAPGDQRWPVAYGSVVVWEDARNGNLDVYGAQIHGYPTAAPDPEPYCPGPLFGQPASGYPGWVWFSVPLDPDDCCDEGNCYDPNVLLGFACSGKLWYWDRYGKTAQVYQPPFLQWDLAVGDGYLLYLETDVENPSYYGLVPDPEFQARLGRQGWVWLGMPGLEEVGYIDFMDNVHVQYPVGGMVRTAGEDYASTPANWLQWGWAFWDTYNQAPRTFAPYLPFGNNTCYPWIGYRLWVNVGTAQSEDDPDQVTLIWP